MFRSVVRAPSLGRENWDIKSFSLLSALSESDDQTAALALSRSLSRPCYFSRLPRPSELVKRELVFLRHPIKPPAPRLTAVIGRSGKDLVRIHTNMERRAPPRARSSPLTKRTRPEIDMELKMRKAIRPPGRGRGGVGRLQGNPKAESSITCTSMGTLESRSGNILYFVFASLTKISSLDMT